MIFASHRSLTDKEIFRAKSLGEGEPTTKNHLKLLEVEKETTISVKFYKEKET